MLGRILRGDGRPSTATDRGVSPGGFFRAGFALVAAVDAVLALLLAAGSKVAASTLALQIAFATGQILLLGFVVGLLCDLGHRFLPRNAIVRPLAAWLIAAAASFVLLAEDYSVFELYLRVPLTLAGGLPFAILAATAPRLMARRALGLPVIAIAAALSVANAFVLGGGYHGIHLMITLVAGTQAGIGLASIAAGRIARGRAPVIAWGAAAIVAAASVSVWPANKVVVALAQHPTASVMALLSHARVQASAFGGAAPPEQTAWFVDRTKAPPVPPTSPSLHPKPIVLLLTVDALRADVVRDPGQPATTHMRELGKRGTVFTQARSPASATSPAIGPLFAGKYYSSLYWTPEKSGGKIKYFLRDEKTPRWSDILEERGIERVLVRRKGGMDVKSGLVGSFEETTKVISWADEIVDEVLRVFDGADSDPMLVYAHLMDCHAPYTSRGDHADPFEGYLSEVAFIDEHLDRLNAEIRKRGLEDRTFVILSADHGEAFGEHRTKHHAATIYEELVRIPLMVVGPGVARREVDEPVSLIDLGPTILDLFGIPTPGTFMGQSLVPLLAGRDVQLDRPLVIDTGRRKQAIVGRDGLKIIRNLREGTVELYDLKADPRELTNLVDERPELAKERLGALAAFFAVHELRKKGYEVPARD